MKITLHFTVKTQTIGQIEDKLFINKLYQKMDGQDELNHCFLPRDIVLEKGFDTGVVDFLDSVCDVQVHWFDTMDNISQQREKMLDDLKEVNGVAIFVGDIVEGVKEEYDLAISKGLDILIIQ